MESDKSGCCGSGGGGTQDAGQIKEFLKKRYGGLVNSPARESCCGGAPEAGLDAKVALMAGYTEDQLAEVPEHAAEHSFGCGNPVALAGIQRGQTVLDIGSGAGIDAILAARKVGPEGRVIGLDMTPEMMEAARRNSDQAGATNVEFRLGDAENMPVDSQSVDWIISNCVINLAPDKDRVFREAHRVLRSGGKMLISDIVTRDLPDEVRGSAAAWAACVAGAMEEEDYLEAIRRAGFSNVQVVARLDYDCDTVTALLEGTDWTSNELDEMARKVAGKISSIKVSAAKARARGDTVTSASEATNTFR